MLVMVSHLPIVSRILSIPCIARVKFLFSYCFLTPFFILCPYLFYVLVDEQRYASTFSLAQPIASPIQLSYLPQS